MGDYKDLTIGERVKLLRKELLHLTGDKFGNAIGVGKSSISAIESNKRNLSMQLFRSICREYNVREEWLRDGTGEPFVEQIVNQDIFDWVTEIMPQENSSFRKRFAYALSHLSDDGWAKIEEFCNDVLQAHEDMDDPDSGKKI